MAAPTALSDTTPGALQTGVKHGFIRKIYFQAAIGNTGAITVDATASDGISATRTSAGLYPLTNLPTVGAKRVLAAGGTLVLPSTAPTAADASIVNFGPFDLAAGTTSIITRAGDDGDVADPTSGSTLLAWIEISCGT